MGASLTEQALQRPPLERLQLMERLWDSLAGEGSVPELTEAQRRELDARLKEVEGDPDAGRPWREVRASLDPRRR